MTTRKIGLLIGGTEEDWPTALEMLFRRFDPIITLPGGEPSASTSNGCASILSICAPAHPMTW